MGECELQVDWRVSVWKTAKQATIDVLVQPEQELAQPLNESEYAPRRFRGRPQDQHACGGPGSLNVLYAFAQPGGNRVAIRNEQKTERRCGGGASRAHAVWSRRRSATNAAIALSERK